MSLERANAVPIGFLHPAFVSVGVLRALINNRPAAKHLHVLHSPQIQAAENECTRRQIESVAALWIQALSVNARGHNVNVGAGGWRRGRRASKKKKHCRMVKKISRPRYRQLGRSCQFEPYSWPLPDCPQPQPPRLNIDAFVPEAVSYTHLTLPTIYSV